MKKLKATQELLADFCVNLSAGSIFAAIVLFVVPEGPIFQRLGVFGIYSLVGIAFLGTGYKIKTWTF